MRGVVLALLMTTAVLAGCLSGPSEELETVNSLELERIVVPDGAELIETPTGAVLEWVNITFPFQETISIPEGATLVKVTGALLEDRSSVRTYMWNEETGRRRCNPDSVTTAWNAYYDIEHQCAGLAAIDPPGTNWTVRATTPVNAETGESVQVDNLVRVVFESTPLDGPVSQLDLDQLDMPLLELKETTGDYVESFDGTGLWVEVTLPEGEGPWPTVIAASPYNGQYNRLSHGGPPAMWEYWTQDWAKRGYAAVNVDVRGFGLSEGCVEVWGENEQRDQAFIVDWVADQPWSDGNVGFYGQSYVGTTPVAAAVQAPEALKAIVSVAPVINAYEDWHYGGVPNGENTGSPVAYQVLTDPGPDPDDTEALMDPLTVALNLGKGICDPTLVARANDPRAIYDDYYEERDFKLRADQVEAAVLFTQGFEDSNVKSAMIPGWFNEIPSKKLGIFGHWVHQHPPRADTEAFFLGWMEEHVKGKDLGFSALEEVIVQTNIETQRTTDAWPNEGLEETLLWPDWSSGTLGPDESSAGGATLGIGPAPDPLGAASLRVSHTLEGDLAVSGSITLQMRGTLEPGGNAFLAARVYDRHDDRDDLITWGMFNLAHDETHTSWTPVTGPSDVEIHMLPTEYVFQEGHELVVELYGVFDQAPGLGLPAARFQVGEHPDGVGALVLDTVPPEDYMDLPMTGQH